MTARVRALCEKEVPPKNIQNCSYLLEPQNFELLQKKNVYFSLIGAGSTRQNNNKLVDSS